MKNLLLLSPLLLGILQGMPEAQGSVRARETAFSYQYLQGLPNLSGYSATCVNDRQEVAGSGRRSDLPNTWVGLYWSSASALPVAFSVPGARCMNVGDIDNAGNIVGSYTTEPCNSPNMACGVSGYLRAPDGTLTYPIDVPFPGALATQIEGINSAGEMVGTYWDASCATRAFFRSSSGLFSDITPPGSTNAHAAAISDSAHIVGWMDGAAPACRVGWTLGPAGHATVTFHDPLLGDATWTDVQGISSSRNEIVGNSGMTCPFPNPNRAYLRRNRHGPFIEIPRPSGATSFVVVDMNEFGDIVGNAGGFGSGAFLGYRVSEVVLR